MGNVFDPRVFEELEKAFKLEGSLRDVKAELYKVDDRAELAELVRDMIAMANTARRQGQPARLILGVREEVEKIEEGSIAEGSIFEPETFFSVSGIAGQCIRKVLPPGWDRLNMAKQADIIDRELHSRLRNYIEPEPEWEYLTGRWREKVVGYIEVRPSEVGPYQVKQEIVYEKRGKQKRIKPGDAWVREGESKKYIPPHQHHLLYCWRNVPYVVPDNWRQYARDCANEFFQPPSEFFVTLQCVYHGGEVSLEKAIDLFLENTVERVLWLSGKPGAGKSVFLQGQMHRLSDQLAQYLDALLLERQLLDRHPEHPIPVWLDLNGRRFEGQQEFAEALAHSLDQVQHLGLRRSDYPAGIFSDENLKFILLLDAWDELDPNAWTESRRSIFEFLPRHVNAKAVITSRPSKIERHRGWTVADMEGISSDVVGKLLHSSLRDPMSLFQLLDEHLELVDAISTPLALKTTLEYAQDKEIEGSTLTLGKLAHEIVMELFRHEAEKDFSPDRELKRLQRISSLQDLAWWLDGGDKEADLDVALDKLGGGDIEIGRENMQIVMDMELLKPTEEGVTFAANVIKAYFFVKKLSKLAKERKEPPGIWGAKVQECQQDGPFWAICQEMARAWTDTELPLLCD